MVSLQINSNDINAIEQLLNIQTDRQKRREKRLKNIKVKKISLYSEQNSSFCVELSPLESWELLARISKESWFLETGTLAPDILDKTKVQIFTRKN
jgi:hypothetical protein